jgi:hypothetical protein
MCDENGNKNTIITALEIQKNLVNLKLYNSKFYDNLNFSLHLCP